MKPRRSLCWKTALWTIATVLFSLFGLISCAKDPEQTEAKQSPYPLHISWKTDVTEPARLTDAPDILYKRTGDLEFDTVSLAVESERTEQDGKLKCVMVNYPMSIHVPEKQGTITGGEWTQIIAMHLDYFMSEVSGSNRLRIALFEPQPQNKEMEDWTPRQLSNWLILPIRIDSD